MVVSKMAKEHAVRHSRVMHVYFVVLLAALTESQVVIRNCPGNVYSTNGEAAWTLPSAEATEPSGDTTPLDVTCNHPPDSTLYKTYETPVLCSATDAHGNMDTCTFSIFAPDGLACSKKGGTAQCTCVEYRPYFDPCQCDDGYSGLDCQVLDGSGCSASNDSPTCDCTSGTCRCTDGFKGKMCDLDFQPPDVTCPVDSFVAGVSALLPPSESVNATDNDGHPVSVECDPPLGSTVDGGGNTTMIFTVVCTARDTAGNRADCSFRVVLDTEPPQIPFCPGTVHTNDSNFAWSLDMAVDDSHPRLDATCTPGPGSNLTAHETTVTCGVQDAAGNAAVDNCTFSIFLDAGSCIPGAMNCDCEADRCWCLEGFSGLNCSVEDGSSCVSSGNPGPGCVCNDSVSCMCHAGFKGASCEIDFQPPSMSNCPFGEIWSYTPVVTYRPIWTADNNDSDESLSEVTCYPEEGSEFYDYNTAVMCSARDPSGNKVDNCEFPVRRSSASGCTEDGNNCYNCASRCRCLPGYYGPTCQVCGSCNNGGTREDGLCQCQCPTLHHGLICDECYEPNADHCSHDGVFIIDTCSCECQGDWTGRHCDQKHAEDCLNEPTDSLGCSCDGTTCSCNDGFEGPKCDMCKACENGGSHQNSETCICECPGHYIPPLCSECNTIAACQNGGTFDQTSCACQCADGWTGKDCNETTTLALKCPSDIIKKLDKSKTSASVTWTDPSDQGAVIECKPSSGSEFTEGTTAVHCTAGYTDTGSKSSCSFNVFIDERAPLVSCPDDITAYHQRWKTTSLITWASVTAEDEVSGTIPATCIPPSGSVFSGETTVVCAALDQARNLGFCTFVAGVYYRGNTLRFPTTMSCAKCSKNPDSVCSYDPDEDEYNCYCPSGFTQEADGDCQDIDECLDESRCDLNAECQNTDGSYRCECNLGFYGSGTTCREYPYTVYPDISELPTDNTPFEKQIAVDVAIASDSMYGCDPNNDPTSTECIILVDAFTQLIRDVYLDFSPALLRIEMDQSYLNEGRIPHVAVYDYSRLSASQRATTAQEFYDATMASRIDNGQIGGLKLVSNCASCESPKDLTNLCNTDPKPKCEEGFSLELRRTDGESCYLTCESLCSTDYCGVGVCTHNPPYEPECRCPSYTVGPRCEPVTTPVPGGNGDEVYQLNIPVIVGCSVAGGVLLIIIVAVIAYFVHSKNSKKKSTSTENNLEIEGKTNYSFTMEHRS